MTTIEQHPRLTCAIDPSTTAFVIVAFEGPDRYSRVGGLGQRVTRIAATLANYRFETHLFFMGDPWLPSEEAVDDGHLVLHRWAQWISAYCAGGVYEAEETRVADVTSSLPPYVVENLVEPLIAIDRPPILLFEEWQTAECACRIAERMKDAGLANRATLVWNASSLHGFDRIDWRRLASSAVITTASRGVRRAIRSRGVEVRFVSRLSRERALTLPHAGTVTRARAKTRRRLVAESPSQLVAQS